MSLADLFEEIRDAASKVVWSRAVELSRRDAVTADSQNQEEIKLRVMDRESGIARNITLFLEDIDWHSDCSCKPDPCHHVCAAVICVKHASDRGEALPRSKTASQKIAYRLQRDGTNISFSRVLVDPDGKELPAPHALSRHTSTALQTEPVAADKLDLAIESKLGSQKQGVLPAASWAKIWRFLTDVDDLTLDGQPVRISKEPLGLIATITDEAGGIRIAGRLDPRIEESFSNGLALAAGCLHPAPSPRLSSDEFQMLKQGRIIASQDLARFAAEQLAGLRERIHIENHSRNLPELVTHEGLRLELGTERIGQGLRLSPCLVYGDPPLAIVDQNGFRALAAEIPARDLDRERALQDEAARRLGVEWGSSKYYQGAAAVAALAALKTPSVTLHGDAWQDFQIRGQLRADISLSSDSNGGLIEIDCQLEEQASQKKPVKASAKAMVDAWQRGESYISLSDGGWAALPTDWLKRYGPYLQELIALRDAMGEKPSKAAMPALAKLASDLDLPNAAQLAKEAEVLIQPDRWRARSLPTDLQATLRPYQAEGVRWLSYLRDQGLGALLADDMGLGKTLQTIAILMGKALIIAPTSVIPNWQRELQRFRPSLKVSIYHGSQRQLDLTSDVIVTSYGLLRLDEQLLENPWSILVLDEAQTIKNPESQIAQAAFQVKADFRLALTGTPIENRLEDLWSQFHFLNPGLLSGREDFRTQYARPILSGDHAAAERLKQRIQPFMMRRLKRDVAPELPPRIDKVLYTELSAAEQELYESLWISTRKEVVERFNSGTSIMEMLEVLLRLRQACCHRALLPGQSAQDSAKIATLRHHLGQALDEGHKALIFSQWTSFLDLIEPHLEESGIEFLRLDGSSRHRGEIVANFQKEQGPAVLLMSLKAGGVGLNLSAADHVFIMDPWWNPAVEDQAADRAHRIGQQNPVMVHPIVALNTVEERILALQQHKRQLADAALQQGTALPTTASQLSREELMQLFEM